MNLPSDVKKSLADSIMAALNEGEYAYWSLMHDGKAVFTVEIFSE